jgi:prostatic aicd phosphatase
MSLLLVTAGLFPPKNTLLEWNSELNWQPIPYSYENLFHDKLLLVTESCPRYYEELERVLREEVKGDLDKHKEMFAELSIGSGWNITSYFHTQHLYGIFKSQSDFGLEIPKWAEKFYPAAMQDLMEKGFIFEAFNSQLKKLKGGVFVKRAIEDWERKVDDKLKEKVFLFSAHDKTGEAKVSQVFGTFRTFLFPVTNILQAFNVWEQQLPAYGIAAMLELSQNKRTKKFGVQVRENLEFQSINCAVFDRFF